jgi:hypothetical protein
MQIGMEYEGPLNLSPEFSYLMLTLSLPGNRPAMVDQSSYNAHLIFTWQQARHGGPIVSLPSA